MTSVSLIPLSFEPSGQGLANYSLFLYDQQAKDGFHIFKGLLKKKNKDKEEYATEPICGLKA